MSSDAPRTAAGAEWAVWLSHSVLLLVGSFVEEVPNADRPADAALAGASMRFAASDRSDAGLRMLVTVVVPEPWRSRMSDGLDIRLGDHLIHIDGNRVASAQTDIATVLRESGLAAAPANVRTSALALLAATARSASDPVRLSRSLHTIREALRERVPERDGADESLSLKVEVLCAIDAQTFYVRGQYAETVDVAELAIVSPEGNRILLHDRIVTYRLNTGGGDGESRRLMGFSACFTTDAPSWLPASWIVELRDTGDVAEEVAAPTVLRESIVVRDLLLEDLRNEPGLDDVLLERHIAPALRRLQPRLSAAVSVASVRECGPQPTSPDISIIVSLGEDSEYLEQQLAQFAGDPAMRGVELIYAIDSRTPVRAFSERAARLGELYRVPFTLALMHQVVDRDPLVLHAVAARARGRLLVFLDRRTLPGGRGWVRAMKAFYDRTPEIGGLVPKLLYVDDLIRGAGVSFNRLQHRDRWRPAPRLRGVPRRAAAAIVSERVSAIASSCLMIRADLFDQVGGFRGAYLRDEYEDADLSLRLTQAGRRNWYFADAELYHLEERIPQTDPTTAVRYDEHVYDDLWASTLDELHGRRQAAVSGRDGR